MKEELERKLLENYPSIYSYKNIFFEHDDGWYDILKRLSQEISENDPEELVRAIQIKEKWGVLNFYYTVDGTPVDLDIGSYHDKIHKIVSKYTSESNKTCEFCGTKEDVERKGSWIKTLCRTCREKTDNQRLK